YHRNHQADVEVEHVARLAGEGVTVDDGWSSHVNDPAAGALDQHDRGGGEVDVEGGARALIGRYLHHLARGGAATELIDEVLALRLRPVHHGGTHDEGARIRRHHRALAVELAAAVHGQRRHGIVLGVRAPTTVEDVLRREEHEGRAALGRQPGRPG